MVGRQGIPRRAEERLTARQDKHQVHLETYLLPVAESRRDWVVPITESESLSFLILCDTCLKPGKFKVMLHRDLASLLIR